MSEDQGSVLGGLEEMGSAAFDAAEHTSEAGFDALRSYGDALVSGGESIGAGTAYAVGSYDTAKDLDSGAREYSQAASEDWGAASDELNAAGSDILGG